MADTAAALQSRDETLRAVSGSSMPVKIYTLGQFTITVDDEPIATGSPAACKPVTLLKALIACGGRNVKQSTLVRALWSDADGDVTRKTFEITLHRLRKLFGTHAPLILKNKELSLDARSCWLDCWALERLLSKLDKAAGANEIEALLDVMFTLYQGPFLGGDDELACVVQMQERLRSRVLRGALRCEDEMCDERAIRCYQRLLEVELTAEEGYRHLIRLHQRAGRHADAKTCYLRCERILHKLLGVAPSFALNAPGVEIGAGFPSQPASHSHKLPPR
jgi:DNA-binding SARP family transcriptional activator